jgi:hypothetical protein
MNAFSTIPLRVTTRAHFDRACFRICRNHLSVFLPIEKDAPNFSLASHAKGWNFSLLLPPAARLF